MSVAFGQFNVFFLNKGINFFKKNVLTPNFSENKPSQAILYTSTSLLVYIFVLRIIRYLMII